MFEDLFAFDTRGGGLTANARTTSFVYQGVTGNYFTGLQLQARLGRVFKTGEGEFPGGEATIVLSYRFWQRRFGGDPSVVGAIVRVDGIPTRVIGVTPEDFHGLYHGLDVEGYVPLGFITGREKVEAALHGSVDAVPAGGRAASPRRHDRRRAGCRRRGLGTAAADLPAGEGGHGARHPETMARPMPMRFIARIMPLGQASMLGLAGLVLLIACMNVANLLLVRGAVRQREMAMRAALGRAADDWSGCCSPRACCWRWQARRPACSSDAGPWRCSRAASSSRAIFR